MFSYSWLLRGAHLLYPSTVAWAILSLTKATTLITHCETPTQTNYRLCGRGGGVYGHHGNEILRGWIAERRKSYNLTDSTKAKSRITSEIMDRVQGQEPPGRFLQRIVKGNKKNGLYDISSHWLEIEDSKALAKISRALWERAPAFQALHGKKGGNPRRTSKSRRASVQQKKKAESPGQGLFQERN